MAGEAEPLAPTPAAGAPSEPAVVASPAAAAPATPEPAPVAAPEPAAPAIVEPVAPSAPVAEPTLLQKFDAEQAAAKPAEPAPVAKPEEPAAAKPVDPAKPAEAKPADAPKPGEPKPEAAAAPVEPAAIVAPEPIAYEYALPETIKLDDATKASFHTALDAFRADPAKGAQGLIDLHNTTMRQYADGLAAEQQRVWNDTRRGWVTDVMADEELGGAGYQTTMGAVARMRDMLVADNHRAEFEQFLNTTGAGDHPAFLRILHNAARIYDEAPMPPPGARPTPDNGKPRGNGLRSLYKSSNGGPA